MGHYTIFVESDDMPFGFKSWLLKLKKDEGLVLKQMTNDDGTKTGLGFDVEEESYKRNKTYVEMLTKFCISKRKTKLKRWYIFDNVKEKVFLHEE